MLAYICLSMLFVQLQYVYIHFYQNRHKKIWSQLGLDGNVSDVHWNEMSNLELKSGHKIGTTEPIFSKIEQSVIDEEQSKLGN